MAPPKQDPLNILNVPSVVAAPRLLGAELERTYGEQTLRVRIVETEAYDETDAASHSYAGPTPRTSVMFGPAGHLYVYFTYGLHYCCNVVVGPAGAGSAVLIRAVEPVRGESTMAQLRTGHTGPRLTNGPAKLCQALAIDMALQGHDLRIGPLRLIPGPPVPVSQIVQTTRVGITRARDQPWRFYIRGNPYVSKF